MFTLWTCPECLTLSCVHTHTHTHTHTHAGRQNCPLKQEDVTLSRLLKVMVWKICSQPRRTDAGKAVTNVKTPLLGEGCHPCELCVCQFFPIQNRIKWKIID